MKRQPTCVASWTQNLLTWSEIRGLPRKHLLSAARLEERDVQRQDGRIPYAAHLAVWEEVQRLEDGGFFGLEFPIFGLRLEAYDSVGYLVRSSDDIGHSIDTSIKYSRWINEFAAPSLTVEGDTAVVSDGPRSGDPWPRHYAEARMALYVVLTRSLTGTKWTPKVVRFQHPRPADVSMHVELFGAPVLFDQPRNEIELDAEILSHPLLTADRKLYSLLVERMEEKMKILPGDDLVRNISHIIVSDLPAVPPKLETVAKQLGLGPRTLQRRLADESTTFQQVADETRKKIAEHYLKERTRSISECSSLVGFSEEAAFRRAFKRWVGVSPRKFRSMYKA